MQHDSTSEWAALGLPLVLGSGLGQLFTSFVSIWAVMMESGLTSSVGTGLSQKRWSQVLPRRFSQLLKADWADVYRLPGLMRGLQYYLFMFLTKIYGESSQSRACAGGRVIVVNKNSHLTKENRETNMPLQV